MAIENSESTVVSDFWGYQILIHLYDGDIEAWKKKLEEPGREQQRRDDLPFLNWLEEQMKEDPDLINRIRRMVKETTPILEQLLMRKQSVWPQYMSYIWETIRKVWKGLLGLDGRQQ